MSSSDDIRLPNVPNVDLGGQGEVISYEGRLQIITPHLDVHMSISQRSWNRLRVKLQRCKAAERQYANWAYLLLGVGIPYGISAVQELRNGRGFTPSLFLGVIFGLSGIFLLRLQQERNTAKADALDAILEDMAEIDARPEASIQIAGKSTSALGGGVTA